MFAQISSPTTRSTTSGPVNELSAVVCNPLLTINAEDFVGDQAPPVTTVSFLEIYGAFCFSKTCCFLNSNVCLNYSGEDIFDLLQDLDGEGNSRSLSLREENGSVSVVGLTEVI